MIKITTEVNATNQIIEAGKFGDLVGATIETLSPEATYFVADNGVRTAYFFADIADPSQLPSIAEPWFMNTNARVEITPAMNHEDLKKGIEAWMKAKS